jgi:hypothetical protein
MKFIIPIGKTYINVESLQMQIDALRAQGYDENDDVKVESFVNIYFRNNKFRSTFAIKVPGRKGEKE